MNDDYMSEADNEVDGGYLADLEYAYQQKEIRRQEDKENKAKKEENRKQQLLRQNKCIENLKIKINKLKQQLAEKDKEIERLNTIKNNAIECADLFKVALSVRQKDLAIQKLEEVKELLLIESKNNPIIYDVNDDTVGGALDRDKTFEVIDQQIKELKGEKDETQNK